MGRPKRTRSDSVNSDSTPKKQIISRARSRTPNINDSKNNSSGKAETENNNISLHNECETIHNLNKSENNFKHPIASPKASSSGSSSSENDNGDSNINEAQILHTPQNQNSRHRRSSTRSSTLSTASNFSPKSQVPSENANSNAFNESVNNNSQVVNVTLQSENNNNIIATDSVNKNIENSANANTDVENKQNSDSIPPSLNEDLENSAAIAPVSVPQKMTAADLGFVEDEDGVIKIDDLVIPPAPAPHLSNDVPDSRLIITDLIIHNFKSYAGIQTISDFEKNFTAVVGPNGSGKSNVIDSLLFVFGYRAKKIRSKKVSHLIHKSELFPNLTFCSVTVHFAIIKDKKEDQYEIVKDSSFILKRTAYADDSSFYEMDNKRVQYKQVAKTLKAYGIDLEHSRFLILQGEIEAISLMQPKGQNDNDTGMLEYIEDIIGSNRLIDPIKVLSSKVGELEEEENVKQKHLNEAEKDRDNLEEPKNAAVEYLRMENKLYLTENSLFHLQRFDAEKHLEETTQKKSQFLEQMKSLKEEMDNMRSSKKVVEVQMQKLHHDYDILAKKIEEDAETYSKYEQQDAANNEIIAHEKEKSSSFKTTLEKTNTELEKLKKQIETYENETSELQIKRGKLEEQKESEEKKMTEVMDSLKKETHALQEKKDKFEGQLIKLKDNVHKIQSEINIAEKELNLLLNADEKEKRKLSELIASHDSTTQSAETEERMLQEEENKIVTLKEELHRLNQELEEVHNIEALLMQKVRTDRLKLEEAKSAMSSSQTQGTIMQALNKEKSQGRLLGVYGRLGDLGAIDEKYDVAISTACGQLDYIVTDTLNTAQESVKFLKKNNVGYATFISLEKMQVWEQHAHSKIQTPENAPRLFDLIRVNDSALLPAFYFALRDTLVAGNLEQATRIGLQGSQRYRVVTVKGELIDLAGTMSGGGGRVHKGRMGQTVLQSTLSAEDVAQMEKDVTVTVQKFSEAKNRKRDLEELISQKNNLLSTLHHSLKKRSLHCKAYKENLSMLNSQICEQKTKAEESTVDEKKVKVLKKHIEEKTLILKESSEETLIVENKVKKLQDEILEISKGKFSKAKKTVDQLGKKLAEVTGALTKSSVNMKTCKRNIKKSEDKMGSLVKDKEGTKLKLAELKEKQHALTMKALKLSEEKTQNEEILKGMKEKRNSIKSELDVFSAKEHEIKSQEIEIRNNLKTYESKEMEKKTLVKHLKLKISKLKLNEVEDDSTDIPVLTNEEIGRLSASSLQADIEVTKARLEEKKPNLSAISEYKQKVELCNERQKAVVEISAQRNLQTMRRDELKKRRASEFLTGFQIIAAKLKEIYQMLTLGGDAELELVDSFDPFCKGVEFSVRPPRKSWKFMRNLSGGEKTLSSLSLVFALHYYRPTPFYVMDEIDAALDVRNVAIVGLFLKKKTVNTQFIIVSLRNVMNELADQLLGIFKVRNCTKNIMLRKAQRWAQEAHF